MKNPNDMKKIVSMSFTAIALASCSQSPKGEAPWIVDRFDDIKVIR